MAIKLDSGVPADHGKECSYGTVCPCQAILYRKREKPFFFLPMLRMPPWWALYWKILIQSHRTQPAGVVLSSQGLAGVVARWIKLARLVRYRLWIWDRHRHSSAIPELACSVSLEQMSHVQVKAYRFALITESSLLRVVRALWGVSAKLLIPVNSYACWNITSERCRRDLHKTSVIRHRGIFKGRHARHFSLRLGIIRAK